MKEIERIRESLQNEDRKYPEGELICARNGKWYKWYLCHQGQSLYLPKDKRELAVKLARKKYIANVANNKYELRIILRPKIRITQEQFDFINKLFSEKMTKGQSISVIYQNHKDEIMISENTVRNYLKRGLLKSNQLDMIRPRFTANKSVKRRVIKNVDLLNGRTYEDYINYTKEKIY